MSEEAIAALDQLTNQLRTNLHLEVRALESFPDPEAQEVLTRQFEHTLNRLSRLHGLGIYEHMTLAEVLVAAIRAEAHLVQEYQGEIERIEEVDPTKANSFRLIADEHRARAKSLAEMLASLGYPEYLQSLPALDLYRGVFVRPFSTEVNLLLNDAETIYRFWQEGVVVYWPHHGLDELSAMADEIKILYYDAKLFYKDLTILESSALEQEFQTRMDAAQDSDTGEAFEHHINHLLLHQHVVLHSLQLLLQPEHPRLATHIQPLLNDSRERIQAGLLAHPSWQPKEKRDGNHLEQLLQNELLLQEHAQNWNAEQADGLLFKFNYFVNAGHHAEAIEALT